MSTPLIYGYEQGKIDKVTRVDISTLGPQEIRALSVVQVTESAIYEKGVARRNAPNDHRMGPIDRRIVCCTCGNKVERCTGHSGHIELEYPIYHIGYMDTTLKILRCVCHWCCRLMVDSEDPKTQNVFKSTDKNKTRFTNVVNFVKNKKQCPWCQGLQPQYKRPKKSPLVIDTHWNGVELENPIEKAQSEKPFTSREALNILECVPDSDYIFMGLKPHVSHPSWNIMTVLVVPPPIIRPSITETEGSRTRGQDDLTHKLKNIVNANNAIKRFYLSHSQN